MYEPSSKIDKFDTIPENPVPFSGWHNVVIRTIFDEVQWQIIRNTTEQLPTHDLKPIMENYLQYNLTFMLQLAVSYAIIDSSLIDFSMVVGKQWISAQNCQCLGQITPEAQIKWYALK